MMLLFPIATDMMLLALQQFTIAQVIELDMESSIYEFNHVQKQRAREELYEVQRSGAYTYTEECIYERSTQMKPQHICISCWKIYEELFFFRFHSELDVENTVEVCFVFLTVSEWHFIIYTADPGGMSVLVFRNTVVHPSISNEY